MEPNEARMALERNRRFVIAINYVLAGSLAGICLIGFVLSWQRAGPSHILTLICGGLFLFFSLILLVNAGINAYLRRTFGRIGK